MTIEKLISEYNIKVTYDYDCDMWVAQSYDSDGLLNGEFGDSTKESAVRMLAEMLKCAGY